MANKAVQQVVLEHGEICPHAPPATVVCDGQCTEGHGLLTVPSNEQSEAVQPNKVRNVTSIAGHAHSAYVGVCICGGFAPAVGTGQRQDLRTDIVHIHIGA